MARVTLGPAAFVLVVACGTIVPSPLSELPAPDGGAVLEAGPPLLPLVDAGANDGDAAAVSPCGVGCGDGGARGCRVDTGAASFCIDETEVTQEEYAVFVARKLGSTIDVGTPCGATTVSAPTINRDGANLPVVGVSFCDARAYCHWAGKRLCGKIGGGTLTQDETVARTSEWIFACTNGGPDSIRISGTCSLATTMPSPARSTCEGARPGLFDMVGNVWEWIDSPRVFEGKPNGVFAGGAYTSVPIAEQPVYGCTTVYQASGDLNFRAQDVGFRCCTD